MGEDVLAVGGCRVSEEWGKESVWVGGDWYVVYCILRAFLTLILTALTETQVRNQLHLEEEKKIADGDEALHATSPSSFIMLGLDLEDSQ